LTNISQSSQQLQDNSAREREGRSSNRDTFGGSQKSKQNEGGSNSGRDTQKKGDEGQGDDIGDSGDHNQGQGSGGDRHGSVQDSSVDGDGFGDAHITVVKVEFHTTGKADRHSPNLQNLRLERHVKV
jgi:hypothetical protein